MLAGGCKGVIGLWLAPAGAENPEEKQGVRHFVGGGFLVSGISSLSVLLGGVGAALRVL